MPVAHLPGNLDMHYYDDDLVDPWKQHETIIMHHGQGKSGLLLYGWVHPLVRDYRVIRVDARGFGESSVPEPGYPWSLDGFTDDLRNLMDHLGIEKAHLIGETIGGTVAMHFAYRFPERLHTLTTCTSPFNFVGAQHYLDYYEIVKERGVEAWARHNGNVRLDEATADPEHREWYLTQMGRTAPHVVMETLAYLSTVNLTDEVTQIQTPSLSITGELSGWYAERAEKLAAMMPNCRYAAIPGVGGFAQHAAPEECAAAWRRFADDVKAGRPIATAP